MYFGAWHLNLFVFTFNLGKLILHFHLHSLLYPQSLTGLISIVFRNKVNVPLSFFPKAATLWNNFPCDCFLGHDNFNLFKSSASFHLASESSLPTTYTFIYSTHLIHHFNTKPLPWVALKCFIRSILSIIGHHISWCWYLSYWFTFISKWWSIFKDIRHLERCHALP